MLKDEPDRDTQDRVGQSWAGVGWGGGAQPHGEGDTPMGGGGGLGGEGDVLGKSVRAEGTASAKAPRKELLACGDPAEPSGMLQGVRWGRECGQWGRGGCGFMRALGGSHWRGLRQDTPTPLEMTFCSPLSLSAPRLTGACNGRYFYVFFMVDA